MLPTSVCCGYHTSCSLHVGDTVALAGQALASIKAPTLTSFSVMPAETIDPLTAGGTHLSQKRIWDFVKKHFGIVYHLNLQLALPFSLTLRGQATLLEIVFVGQCEVFICLWLWFFFPLGREAHRSMNGVSVLLKKMLIFPLRVPLRFHLTENVAGRISAAPYTSKNENFIFDVAAAASAV